MNRIFSLTRSTLTNAVENIDLERWWHCIWLTFFPLHHSHLFLRYHIISVSRTLTFLSFYENVGILVKLWFWYIILCLLSRSVFFCVTEYLIKYTEYMANGSVIFQCMYENDTMASCMATYCSLSKYFEQINASMVHRFLSNWV